jgi:hypothetical protein
MRMGRRAAPVWTHWKPTLNPSVKFETAAPPTESRCQAWKFHVSPAATATSQVGVGVCVRSRSKQKAPVPPVFWI